MAQGTASFRGQLSISVQRHRGPGLRWKLSNNLRPGFIWGWIVCHLARWFSRITGAVTVTSELELLVHHRDGSYTNYGVVCRRVITNAGVAFLVDDWDNDATNITDMNYHGMGTGTNAEDVTDTALQTESTTALNPNDTRATGTKSQPAANQLRSVGTLTVDANVANTEHGLFSAAPTGTGTLWDRSVYSVVNVLSGESITFTYTCTVNAGG